jgi:hypothetical protein
MSEEDLLELGEGEESTENDSEDLADGGYHSHGKPFKEEKEEVEVEDEPEIEVIADKKKAWVKDPLESVNEDSDDDYSKSVKKRIGKLRASATELARQRDQIAQEKEELLNYAKSQADRLAQLEAKMAQDNKKSIKYQEDNFNQMSVMAENEYKNALLTGNADSIASAHNKLTDAKVNLSQLKRDAANQEAYIEQLSAQHKNQAQQKTQQVQTQTAPVARVNWFQKNAWFNAMGGDEMSDHAIRVNNKILSEGYTADSPEYFEAIDKGMRSKFPSNFGVKRVPVTPPTTRQSSATSEGVKRSGNKITFSASQMATAKKLGIYTNGMPEKEKNRRLAVYAKQIESVEKK